MSSERVIKVQGLGKCYPIFNEPHHRLLQMFLPRLQRVLGLGSKSYYREFWALRNLSFEVAKGETVGIIGRNGSGKSTLLQIVCGTLSPTEGQVETFGRVAALLELGAGFNPEFTGRENVVLYAQVLGLTKRQIASRFDAIVAFADIGDFLDQPLKIYSSGMFVRLAFAVAVHTDPNILIVDEALAVGDTPFQTKCLARIREMQQSGAAILLVSHSANTLIEFCDRAIYLQRGSLVISGESRDVVERYCNDVVTEEGGIGISRCEEANAAERDAKDAGPEASDRAVARVAPAAPALVPRSEIIEVKILDCTGRPRNTFSYGDEVIVFMRIRFNQENPEPCFGVQLSSVDGISLWSTTTQLLKLSIPRSRAGTEEKFSWRLRLNVGGARFVVAAGVGEIINGEYLRQHRHEYAGHFDVLPRDAAGAGWLGVTPTFVQPSIAVKASAA